MTAEGIRLSFGKAEHSEDADWLKSQFLERHILPLGEGENLEYTLVRPEKEGERIEWVVIVVGFASTKEMWKEEIFDLVKKSGKSFVFVTPDKGIAPDDKESEYF